MPNLTEAPGSKAYKKAQPIPLPLKADASSFNYTRTQLSDTFTQEQQGNCHPAVNIKRRQPLCTKE